MLNPIKRIRTERGWTQQELADFAGVTRHAVLRTEQGVYALPPPAILSTIAARTEYSYSQIENEYRTWVSRHRRQSGLSFPNAPLAVSVFSGPEFVSWREEALGIDSRMGFCRTFCVHPAVVDKYEKSKQHKMPDQLREALFEAGLLGRDY